MHHMRIPLKIEHMYSHKNFDIKNYSGETNTNTEVLKFWQISCLTIHWLIWGEWATSQTSGGDENWLSGFHTYAADMNF